MYEMNAPVYQQMNSLEKKIAIKDVMNAKERVSLAQAAHDRGHHDAHARGRRVAASAPCSSKDSAQSPNKTVSVKHL